MPHGVGKEVSPDGDNVYEGEFVAGQRQGQGKIVRVAAKVTYEG